MLVIGLTGSIGMGKSTLADVLRQNGIAVLDADQVVHDLYAGPAVEKIETVFPGTTRDGKVDRSRLSMALAGKPAAFQKLEALVHPLVWQAQADFLREQNSSGARVAVLEIPLLFETGGEARVDVTIVASASPQSQRARVLERPGMTEQKLNDLLSRQMPDAEKRTRADFVVDTDLELTQSAAQIIDVLAQVANREGRAFDRYWNKDAG